MSKNKSNAVQHPNLNDRFLENIAKSLSFFGKNYNDFQSFNDENIPLEGAAILLINHSLIPIDAWYFALNFYLRTNRMIRAVSPPWIFRTPVFKQLAACLGCIPPDLEKIKTLIKQKELLGLQPHSLIPMKTIASLAIESQIPVLPVITKNNQKLYSKTGFSKMPVLGLGLLPFPVQLQTWVGEPIKAKKNISPETFSIEIEQALKSMKKTHQDSNQNIFKTLQTRLREAAQ